VPGNRRYTAADLPASRLAGETGPVTSGTVSDSDLDLPQASATMGETWASECPARRWELVLKTGCSWHGVAELLRPQ
jgi:hypothetical protein